MIKCIYTVYNVVNDSYLLLNFDVSLLRKDIRPCCVIDDVSCVCDGTTPGPLYVLLA